MINRMYFPRNKMIDDISKCVINAFDSMSIQIDSSTNKGQKSNDVLEIMRPQLEKCSFEVEKGKKKENKINIPVLFGANGKIEKSFDVDAYLQEEGYVIEIEAGRAVCNYQFLKDFFEACTIIGVKRLCIAVRNDYRGSDNFSTVCTFFDTLYTNGRLNIPLDSLLIIGY